MFSPRQVYEVSCAQIILWYTITAVCLSILVVMLIKNDSSSVHKLLSLLAAWLAH